MRAGAPAAGRGARRRAGPAAGRPATTGSASGSRRIGTSSFAYRYGVFAGDECVATGESASVHVGTTAPPPAARRACAGAGAAAHRRARSAGRPERDPACGPRDLPVPARRPHPLRRPGHEPARQQRRARRLVPRRARRAAPRRARLPDRRPAGRAVARARCRVQYLDEVHYPGIYQLRVGVLDLDETTSSATPAGCSTAALHRPGRGRGRRATRRTRTATPVRPGRGARAVPPRAADRSPGPVGDPGHATDDARRDAVSCAAAVAPCVSGGDRPRTGRSSTVVANPAAAASSAVARTQWSVAMPDDVHGVDAARAQPVAQPRSAAARRPRSRSTRRRTRPCRTPPRSGATSRSGWNDAPGRAGDGSAAARCRRSRGSSEKCAPGSTWWSRVATTWS